jgi:rhamnosyltransferase subunit B
LLALARELLERNYTTHVLGNEWAAAPAAADGIPFTSIAPTYASNLGSVEENYGRYVFPSYGPTFRFFEGQLARGAELVVVNWTNLAASTLMCERHRLPLCRLVLAPYYLPSLVSPPEPWASRMHGPLGRAFSRHTLPALYAAQLTHPFILQHINAHRSALGLDAIQSTAALDRLVDHYVALFPDWYCPAPPDWPTNLDRVGFPLPVANAELPQSVSTLIEEHGPPLVFTPGTGAGDTDRFFENARRCCEALDAPGVLLGGSPTNPEPSGKLVRLAQVELGTLLARSALLVHHGGMGTTARGLEAGIPQIIIPDAYDQPDNGGRVEALGVGAVLPRATLSAQTLIDTSRRLLGSAQVQERARDYAAKARDGQGVARAVDVLLEHFALRPPAASTR